MGVGRSSTIYRGESGSYLAGRVDGGIHGPPRGLVGAADVGGQRIALLHTLAGECLPEPSIDPVSVWFSLRGPPSTQP